MRKITSRRLLGIVTPVALVGAVVATAPTASAATDHRPCVTRGEWNSIQPGDTIARVKRVFDTNGTRLTDRSYGYWVGDYVWDEDLGDYVWDDYATWQTDRDVVHAYRKCSAWGGAGRAAIDFDNYSDGRTGLRAYGGSTGHARDVADFIDYLYDTVEGSYLSAPDAVQPPSGFDEKKLPQTPDGRRPAKPAEPPTTASR